MPSRRAFLSLTVLLTALIVILLTLPASTPAEAQPALAFTRQAGGQTVADGKAGQPVDVEISSSTSTPEITRPLREFSQVAPDPSLNREVLPRGSNRLGMDLQPAQGGPDALLASSQNDSLTPPVSMSFEGLNSADGGGFTPPDTVGDVGPNHYMQGVNLRLRIFNKSGGVVSTVATNSFWTSGSCNTTSMSDPVIHYDEMADRWIYEIFKTTAPRAICVAVSQTNDPTGAWYAYTFASAELPDYLKIGVWPNAYYMGTNESSYTAYALDRPAVLAGGAATLIRVTGQTNLLLPADVDSTLSPPSGPGYLYTYKDDSYHGGGVDRLELFTLTPDFVTPANSALTLVQTIPITSYTYTVCGFFILNCIPQSGTTSRLDPVSEWPMHRFVYRNYGTHESLTANFTIDIGADRAGIRWFELRRDGMGAAWTLYQEGTHAPGSEHYWMGSMAPDQKGNLALGYSRSSSTTFPSIIYSTRLVSDPLNTFGSEVVLQAGGGSQTAGSNRWGDYSSMNVDPVNDCTFWYTQEYHDVTSGSAWNTRVGTFTIPECLTADYAVYVAPNPATVCVGSTGATTANSLNFNSFAGNVTLALSGLPAGVSASFGTNPIAPPASSTITFNATGAAMPGTYTPTLTGTSGANTRTDIFTLNVLATPSAAVLTAPTNGTVGTSTTPTLTWAPVTGATSYTVQVATDPGFTSIVQSQNTASTSYIISPALAANTVYYWRVLALSPCGNATSAVSAFQTAPVPICTTTNSTNVPLPIPPTGTSGTTNSTLTISGATGTISDVNVRNLNGTHTFISDLQFELISPATTNVNIIDNVCGNSANFGLNLDDGAATVVGGNCPITGGSTYRPSTPLSAFNGQSPNGTWTLRIVDGFTGDGGTLTSWGLEICTQSATSADFSDLAPSYGVASHSGTGTLRFGTLWDSDTTFALNSDDATDDGITVDTGTNWRPGGTSTAGITIQGSDGNDYVAAWFDWNNDGDFDEVNEKAFAVMLTAANTNIPFTIPAGAIVNQTVEARFRLYEAEPTSANFGTETPTGMVADGEVQDYSAFVPLAVTMAAFEAAPDGNAVLVAWETASENDNVGFNLLRGTDSSAPAETLNGELIPSQSPGGGVGASYTWRDETVEQGATYFYWLDAVDAQGQSTRFGPVSATTSIPTAVEQASLTATSAKAGTTPIALLLGAGLVVLVGAGWLTRRVYGMRNTR